MKQQKLNIVHLCICSFLLSKASIAEQIVTSSNATSLNAVFETQVRVNNSVGNATRSFIARYPENTVKIVETALDIYPTSYKEVISASVSAQPNFVDEILEVAISRKLAPTTELLELAIKAEPSYAEYAAEAACEYSPEQFNELVKTAVSLEPDSADQIAQKLVTSHPSKAIEILVTTIKEVPLVGKYVVDALLAIFPENSAESESMIIISVEQLAEYPEALERLIHLANMRGIEKKAVYDSALRGGADEKSLSAFFVQHYGEELKDP